MPVAREIDAAIAHPSQRFLSATRTNLRALGEPTHIKVGSDRDAQQEQEQQPRRAAVVVRGLRHTQISVIATGTIHGAHGGQHGLVPLSTTQTREKNAIFDLLYQTVGQGSFQSVAGEELVGAVAGGQNHHQTGARFAVAHAILARQRHGKAIRVVAFETIDHHHECLHTAIAFERSQLPIE